MVRKSQPLLCTTAPGWITTVLSDFDAFLIDHASCERKANALMMSLIVKYQDRPQIIPDLIDLAQEELEHFAETYAFMAKRGLQLSKDAQDPYVNELLKHARHGRDERFIDRLLISSVVESRGAERFKIVADNMTDPELAEFYTRLWKSETKHAHVFVMLLSREFPAEVIDARYKELIELEAQIVARLKFRPALH